MAKKKDEITIRSSAAEYLTYVASVGDQQDSIEMRYEDENIWNIQSCRCRNCILADKNTDLRWMSGGCGNTCSVYRDKDCRAI